MNTQGSLQGKVAVVTGAAGGIGSAVAQRLSEDGARVVLVDLDGDAVQKVGTFDYLKYVRHGDRPPLRNYTVREYRPELGELDVDFVVHGALGIAGPWARTAQPEERVVLMDQGTGFDFVADASVHLLVGDESALPAILGILRDMPRDARGLAIIEIPDMADVQDVSGPDGVEVHWLPRGDSADRPGTLTIAEVKAFTPEEPATLSAYLVGERTIPAEGRRHLVSLGVPKSRVEERVDDDPRCQRRLVGQVVEGGDQPLVDSFEGTRIHSRSRSHIGRTGRRWLLDQAVAR